MAPTAQPETCGGAGTALRYRRLFEEEALRLKLSGKVNPALYSMMTAHHLGCGAPAGDSPVIYELVLLSILSHWPEEIPEEDDPDHVSSLLDDSELFDESGLFRRTESGLIVPR